MNIHTYIHDNCTVSEFGLTVPNHVYDRIRRRSAILSETYRIPAEVFREEQLSAYVHGRDEARCLEVVR